MLAVKKIVIRSICHQRFAQLLYRLFADRIPSRGFRIDPGGRHVSWHAIPRLFWGLYEKAEIKFVQRYLRADLDVVELGASLGVVSLHIAKQHDASHKLVCVEANPDLISVIRKNLDRNITGHHAEVLNLAISNGEDTHVDFELTSDPLESRITGAATRVGRGARRTTVRQVRAVKLSEVLQQNAIGRFALVADIEGAEAAILQTDLEALENCQQVIWETHPASYADWGCSVEDLHRRLQESGFTRRDVRGPVECWERMNTPPSRDTSCRVNA